MQVHEMIRDFIKSEPGLTIKYVATKADIEYQTFQLMLRGKRKITIDVYEDICRKGLGLSPKYFFDD